MATPRQRQAPRRNIKEAIAGAKRKRAIAHMPKRTRAQLARALHQK